MIRLHERLSEFSYGYGVTREVEVLLASVGLRATPFLPSLLHEASLGFDVGFQTQGRVVILQFKLGEELRRFHRSSPAQAIPLMTRPFWRFRLDTSGHQFQRLLEFENEDADVYYVAPRFSHWTTYESAFQSGTILESSLLLKPSEIQRGILTQGGTAGVHRVVYDSLRRYICSEPEAIEEETPDEMARGIGERAQRHKVTLESQIVRIFNRSRSDKGPGSLAKPRQETLFARALTPLDAMAAIIGLEAWSQGAQMIFVSSETPTAVSS